ncbi:hypothetical protein B0H16DRAFT_1605740 [Mycena metata]|uniref:F-box domain-containing protein n=1 Tax=Mycena metata TaxID=1033252 RepID=A0AAD7MJ20_9AGAR|nr:hypothetical protein B0H16DRAFT_1605740 [Mycena metata]
MLLDLSGELLEEIGTNLIQTDRANLRAVCKNLGGPVDRLFFSVLVLKTGHQLTSGNGVEILRALATGETKWSLYAKALRISPGKQARNQETKEIHINISDNELQDLLASALKSMPKIRTVAWDVHEQACSEWERDTICDFLNILVALKELELNIQGNIDFSQLSIRGIRKFTLKTPKLWRSLLRLSPSSGPPLMYQQIPQLVPQNRITSLHLEGGNQWSQVWTMLRRTHESTSRIKLSDIITSVVTPELFDHLTSYSGLERLTLKFPDGGSRDVSDRLADTFFETVLPHHAASLTELSCPAAYESRFSFGEHNVGVVSLLHNLTSLEMSVNAGAVRKADPPPDGTRIRLVSIGVSVTAEQSDIDPVVTLLLQTIASLPALRSLAVVSAETERNRGAWCGNGRIHHKGAVDVAIANAVKTFRSNVPCSAIVRAGYQTYELHPISTHNPEREGLGGELGMLGYQQMGSVLSKWRR